MATNAFATILESMGDDAAAEVLAAAAARLATGRLRVIGPEEALHLDDLAEMEIAVPQWQDGRGPRGVVIRALTVKDRMLAERAARVTRKDGTVDVDPWRLQCEEVAAGICRPAKVTADVVLGWNDEAVQFLHGAILRLGPLPSALVAEALGRMAGPDAAGDGGGDPAPDGMGADPGPAPWVDDGEPARDEHR